MTATAAQVARIRRMTNEVGSPSYSDDDLAEYIESYPLLDERGEEPYTWDTSTSPPTQDDNDGWIATYDLHAAAADIWEEKASVVSVDFDFSADGGRYDRSQVYEQYMKQCRFHRSKRSLNTTTMHSWPRENGAYLQPWIGNLAEPSEDW